jgi:hypothetical protein
LVILSLRMRVVFVVFGIILNFAITPLRAQSTALPPDVRARGISCTFGRAGAITQHTAGDYLAVLIPYVGLLALCFFGPFAYYRTRKSLTGEARLDANLVNMWRLALLANGFPSEWAVQHVPSQGQLDTVLAIMGQGLRPLITVANGEVIISSQPPAVAAFQFDTVIASKKREPGMLAETQPETPGICAGKPVVPLEDTTPCLFLPLPESPQEIHGGSIPKLRIPLPEETT